MNQNRPENRGIYEYTSSSNYEPDTGVTKVNDQSIIPPFTRAVHFLGSLKKLEPNPNPVNRVNFLAVFFEDTKDKIPEAFRVLYGVNRRDGSRVVLE